MVGHSTSKRLGGASGPRSDLPLFAGSVIGMVLAGLAIFVTVAAATPGEQLDSNSPNATTPGPASSFPQR